MNTNKNKRIKFQVPIHEVAVVVTVF